MQRPITQEQVLATRDSLPAFPRVVLQILQTLDDPQASLSLLSRQVETDAVIAARVLSLCNSAQRGGPGRGPVNDVFTALSLVGMARVREAAMTIQMASFVQQLSPSRGMEHFWSHSLASAVCGVELAHYTPADVCVDASLIACLLHDVGHLWMQRFVPDAMAAAQALAQARGMAIEQAERELLGVDHAAIGHWLAQGWQLSDNICKGIAYHHAPQDGLPEPLVAVVHVAEVLNHALSLSHGAHDRLVWISDACCALLGLDWGDDSQALFGRIEARCRHAFAPYQGAATGGR